MTAVVVADASPLIALHQIGLLDLGILLAAKRKGRLERVRPSIEALVSRGFWVAPRVVERVLLAAGEDVSPPNSEKP